MDLTVDVFTVGRLIFDLLMSWMKGSCPQPFDVDTYALNALLNTELQDEGDCVPQALTGRLQTDLQ